MSNIAPSDVRSPTSPGAAGTITESYGQKVSR
jgi:hypothetical protein